MLAQLQLVALCVGMLSSVMPTLALQPDMECSWDSGKGATFDWSDWAGPNYITVHDSRYDPNDLDPNGDFVYSFSACYNTEPIPQHDWCRKTNGSDGPSSAPAPAFQYYDPGHGPPSATDKCWRLGADLTKKNSHVWSLLFGSDTSNPAEGVSLTYQHGDACHSGHAGRSVTLHMECEPTMGMWNVNNVTVIEDPTCEYHMILKSKYGCPTECEWGETKGFGQAICSGNGVCDYDKTNGYAKCFCNEGHSGSDCSEEGDKGTPTVAGHGGAIFGFLILGVVIGVACGGGAYYYFVIVRGGGQPGAGFSQLGDDGHHGASDVADSGGYVAPDAGGDDDAPVL